jgi:Arc/MetJ family transcription regulator
MRTTIRIDDELFRQAKRTAAETGRTLTEVVEDALRQTLAPRQLNARRKRIVLPTFDGGHVRPGVDLDDSAALLDIMEADDAAP